ncbi:macrosialin-like isoform X1 [Varroa destructor]|uniref:Lysosome-associated membrane glycoprotein 2-like transmembrane domain-containing protein n=2 Tax=Varroa destructor TaxID=109461 RepID=A0A7M7KQW3_VARDE|nr:macrosialin-like isoform X1 [Varroa destructor]
MKLRRLFVLTGLVALVASQEDAGTKTLTSITTKRPAVTKPNQESRMITEVITTIVPSTTTTTVPVTTSTTTTMSPTSTTTTTTSPTATTPTSPTTTTTTTPTTTTTTPTTTTTTEKPSTPPTTPTASPTSSSSTTTTASPPTPTPVPNPKIPALGNFTLENNAGQICLIVQTRVAVAQRLNKTEPYHLNFGNGTVSEANSKCGKEKIILWINFVEQNSWIQVTFLKTKESYFVGDLAVKTDHVEATSNNTLRQFEVAENKYYKCSQASEVSLGEKAVYLVFSDMKYEAFRTSNSANFVGVEKECTSDYHSDVMIIAIGCAIALFVVIVLIAYLIARRRSRQRGYQPV